MSSSTSTMPAGGGGTAAAPWQQLHGNTTCSGQRDSIYGGLEQLVCACLVITPFQEKKVSESRGYEASAIPGVLFAHHCNVGFIQMAFL